MSDKKSNDSRRKLLKSIAAGSGAVVAGKSIPESWSRPIVNSVVLPAHADTSPETTSKPSVSCPGGTCEVLLSEPFPGGFGILVLAGIVHIKGSEPGCAFSGSAPINPDGSFSVKVACGGSGDGPGTITGTITSDCKNVSGAFKSLTYSGLWNPTLTSFDECDDDEE